LFGWSPVVPTRYASKFAYGHSRENCDVIVSGGLGCSIMPFRLGVPPEIVLVTLGGGKSNDSLKRIELTHFRDDISTSRPRAGGDP
jgi:hypothetical protein